MRRIIVITLTIMLTSLVMGTAAQQPPADPLEQHYISADGSFVFRYPAGWTVRSSEGWLALADSESTFETPSDQLQSGQIQTLLFTVQPAEVELAADADLDMMTAAMAAQLGAGADRSEIAIVERGDQQIGTVSWTTTANQIKVFVKRGTPEQFVVLVAATMLEGMAQHEETLLGMAGTFRFVSLEERGEARRTLLERWLGSETVVEYGDDQQVAYFILVPESEAPPGGYPVLLAMHGLGGTGLDTMLTFAEAATRFNAIVIAPTVPYDTLENTAAAVSAILEEVSASYPLDERGLVMYGFSAGGSFVTYYANLIPEQVRGVVAEGAPLIVPPLEDVEVDHIQYVIVYGTEDLNLNEQNYATATDMEAAGYTVHLESIPDGSHQIAPRTVFITINLLADTGEIE